MCNVFVLFVALSAEPGLKQVHDQLTPFTTLHATFTEEKRVTGLTRPLKSTGRLSYERTKGLLWEVEKPLPSQTVMTPTRVVQRVKGRVTMKLDVAAQPSMQVISRLFVAAVTGEWSTLEADFTMAAEQSPSGWKLTLTPKGGLFAKIASRLEITGKIAVDKIVLFELTGDTTTTTLAGHQFDLPLSVDEEKSLVANE